MERLLLLWDELDDIACACRHVATTTATEFAAASAPALSMISTGFGVLTLWYLLPR